MRRAAFAAAAVLLAAASCDFPKLSRLLDGGTSDGLGGDTSHIALTWQVAATQTTGTPADLVYPPLDPAVAKVRIATLDEPFREAAYLVDVDKPGWILVPRSYFGTTWRLEYTVQTYGSLPGVPHEVQWAPQDGDGHLTVPVAGRIEREPAPAGTGYHIAAPAGVSFSQPVVYTTGMWSHSATTLPFGARIDYDLNDASWLSPPQGRPDQAKGDRALLVDFFSDTAGASASMCRIATGWGELPDATPRDSSTAPQSIT